MSNLYLAVGFPYPMIEYYEKAHNVEKELKLIRKAYGSYSSDYEKEKSRIFTKYDFDQKLRIPNTVILAASLNKKDIINKTVWDSEGGYYSHILICRNELPYQFLDWCEEIKWLQLKEYGVEDDFGSAAIYETIDKPEYFKHIHGWGL